MLLLKLLCFFLGSVLTFYGSLFIFVTMLNAITEVKYTPLILILASILWSIGITLFTLGAIL